MNRTGGRLNIGIVSQYPPPNATHARLSGIASYCKNLVTGISNQGHNLFVLGNRLEGVKPSYNENGVNVTRCWDMGIKSCFQIARKLLSMRKELDIVHIQYTFSLYGGATSALVFPLLLLLLRVFGIPVVVTLHEVVPLSSLNKSFWDEAGVKGNHTFLKIGIHQLVRLIVWLSNAVIVHESFFKDAIRTQYKCKTEKIHVINHGIERRDTLLDQTVAKDLLGIDGKHVLLFFGYLAKYKGLARLIDAFAEMGEDYTLIVAGGEHPRLKGERDNEIYLSSLHERAATSKGEVRFTGFVDEANIPLYFSAADVVIFPYARLISASGPMALCIAHNKPFLASESLAGVIGEPDILFPNTVEGMRSKLNQFFVDKSIGQKSTEYGEMLVRRQPWFKVVINTISLYKQMLLYKQVLYLPELHEQLPESVVINTGGHLQRQASNVDADELST